MHGPYYVKTFGGKSDHRPEEVKDRLGLRPGDTIHYVITSRGVVLVSEDELEIDPFVCFDEWASPEDEEAFKDL